MSGFILMHREIFDNPILKDGDRFRAWLWLVSEACWKPTKFDIRGTIVELQRGQLCMSRDQLAKAWGWSPSAVERFLTRLQTEQMIGRETGQGRSIITICNYDKFQSSQEQSGQPTGQPTGQPADSQRTAKEQGNKGTREEEPNGSPSHSSRKGTRLQPDWAPGPLPETVAALAVQWPPGRLDRELEAFRDYWLSRSSNAAKSDWDRTWHNRIRDQHDRVMRDFRNDRSNNRGAAGSRYEPDGAILELQRRNQLADYPEPAGSAGRWDDYSASGGDRYADAGKGPRLL